LLSAQAVTTLVSRLAEEPTSELAERDGDPARRLAALATGLRYGEPERAERVGAVGKASAFVAGPAVTLKADASADFMK
jgi:hypothetical protein